MAPLHNEVPPKAVIYARYSTDLQNERSNEDQIALCKAFADREGFSFVSAYADKAASGASMHGRSELARMLADAKESKFDVVLVEAFDRLSRDIADMATLHKQLAFIGVRIIAVNDGEANTISVALRGLVAQLFREDNAHKVRRGMTGLIKLGLSAGGKPFGYRPDPGSRGKLSIVPEEASVVCRILEDYGHGISPKAICRRLNAERIPPPRGKLWSPSALHGKKDRGSGILRNPIYVGKIVWDKVRMVKNPDTGKRVSRPNPESEWKSVEVPELRIVSDELFEAVQIQLARRSHRNRSENIVMQRRPKYLLSGLIKCGACGSGMSRMGKDRSGRVRLRCSAHTNSGTCPNPQTFYADEVEELVVDSLTRELATPEQIKIYTERYIEAHLKQNALENQRRTQIEARIATIAKDNNRLLDLLLDGLGEKETIDARMKAQGQERSELEQELTRISVGSKVLLHPAAIKHLLERLTAPSKNRLRSRKAKTELTLYLLDDLGELAPIVRELVHAVTIQRDDDDGRLLIRVEASLVPFLQQNGKFPGDGNDGSGGGT